MSESPPEIRKPRTDDLQIGQITASLLAYPVVLVAHELRLFPLLAEKPRTLQEVCTDLEIRERAAEAILSIVAAVGLVKLEEGRFSVTELSEDYLLESSPTHWCHYLDFLIQDPALFSFESIRRALLSDKSQIHEGRELFDVNKEHDEQAERFTRWMHSVSVGPAQAWPEQIDLSGFHSFLDVAGGSGAHSIGVALKWNNLKLTLLDMEPVCRIADEYIARQGLQKRVSTCQGNMWEIEFPPADVHFYSQIFHDWSREKCLILAKKSFNSLPAGGRVIVHELLYNTDKTGPLRVASVNLLLSLLYSEGRQYSGQEIQDMLEESGFTEVEIKTTFGYWGIVTGVKPKA